MKKDENWFLGFFLSLCGRCQSQFPHGDLQVGPGFFLLAGVAEQISRVIGDDELCAADRMHTAAEAGEWLAAAEQPSSGGGAESD
jgi:hypothetical protein